MQCPEEISAKDCVMVTVSVVRYIHRHIAGG